jgi:hypothetical protein
MRLFLFLLALWAGGVTAQIPRTKSGQFEYSGEVSGVNAHLIKEKAARFFNQPFLVHWDSIARDAHGNRVLGTGYITVRAKQHAVGFPSEVNVFMQFEIEVLDGGYRYKVSHFMVEQPDARNFPLETKPATVKRMAYDQLKHKTHERVSFIIGWLKKYMQEEG